MRTDSCGVLLQGSLAHRHGHEGQRQRLEVLSTGYHPFPDPESPKAGQQQNVLSRRSGNSQLEKKRLDTCTAELHSTGHSPPRSHTTQSPGCLPPWPHAACHSCLGQRHCMLSILSEAAREWPPPEAHSDALPMLPACRLMLFSIAVKCCGEG